MALKERNLPIRTRIGDQGDVNDGAVFFVALVLIFLIAAVLLFGGSWLIPPIVPSTQLP